MQPTPISYQSTRASAGATNEDVDLATVPPGWTWELHHVAAEDETTAFDSLRIGIRNGVSFRPLEEQISPAAATLYFSPDPWHLVPGDSIVARFKGTTSGDILQLYANGVARRIEAPANA